MSANDPNPLTVLHTPTQVRIHLADARTQPPSLHPRIDHPNATLRWNGWNSTVTVGEDALQRPLLVQADHYASGGSPDRYYYALSSNRMRTAGVVAPFAELDYPVRLLPARSIINHPEHTPPPPEPLSPEQDGPAEYAEHAKMRRLRAPMEAVHNFLDHSNYVLALRDDQGALVRVPSSTYEIVAEHFGINLARLDKERRVALDLAATPSPNATPERQTEANPD